MNDTDTPTTDPELNEQELHHMFQTDMDTTVEHARNRRITRGFAIASLVVVFLGVGTLVLRTLPGSDSPADATSLSAADQTRAGQEYMNALAADEKAKAIELAKMAEAGKKLDQQLESGFSPWIVKDPYAGPPVSGWLWIKPNATSLSPEYDTKHKRIPVHSDSGEVIGYDYTYIGFVPLELADSPSFDEHAVRFEAFGGCDPFPTEDTTVSCDMHSWVQPHAK